MALVFSGDGATPLAEYLKWVVLFFPKKHLEPRRVNPASGNWLMTLLRSSMCMVMSFEDTMQSCT